MQAARGPVTQAAPRVTTLSGASGEVTAVKPGRSRTPMFVAAAAVLAVAGGVGLVMSQKKAPPATTVASVPAPPPQEQPPPPPKDELVTISVTSDPPGAHVLRADEGGADVGKTPFEVKVKKGSPPFDIALRLDGYKQQTRTVTSEMSKDIEVALAKEAPAPAPALAPTPAVEKPEKPAHAHAHASHAAPKRSKDDPDDIMQPQF